MGDQDDRDSSRRGRDKGMQAARRYSPRGRSVGDSARDDERRRRAATRSRDRDSLTPALRLVEGGGEEDPAPSRTQAARERARKRTPIAPVPESDARSSKARQAQRASAARGSGPRRVIKKRLPRVGNPRRRLRFGMALVLLVFAIAGGRLVQLQVTDAAAYAADALGQRLQEEVVPGSRGAIVDRDGGRMAFSAAARYVYADPELVEDPKAAAKKLTPLLAVPESELLQKMKPEKAEDGTPLRFNYLARGVDVDVGNKVEKLDIPGVHSAYDERREVPGHDLAANILGFTGTDGDGLAGIESTYDQSLAGHDGERKYEVSASGQQIPGGFEREEPARQGSDVQLTLDSDLQYEVQRSLADTIDKKDAKFGAAVVMDSSSGEVLSMASAPGYDAADPFGYDKNDKVDWASDAVVEPGSVHKALIMGAALEEGLIDRDDDIMVPPTVDKGGKTYRDTHSHEKRPMTLGGILAHSSNVGIIKLAEKLGPKKIYEYQQKFGLGQPTGAGVESEAGGIVRDPSTWQGADYGSIPIGLGVAVTPLQMAAGYSAIANDGQYIEPTLVQHTVKPNGEKAEKADPKKHRVMSGKSAHDLQYLMQGPVVVPDGTGTLAEIPGYNVAGKTGTGKLVKNGEYASGEVASFVGFAPADKPKYTVAVFAYTDGGGGGEVTGTAFRDIMQFTLGHYREAPSAKPPADIDVYP